MVTGATEVQFEGITEGGEVLGATQASFVVYRPGQHAKEASVLLNDPSAAYLAGLLGVEDAPEFRRAAAQAVGQAWLEMVVAAGHHIESVIFLSKGSLESHPLVVEAAKAAHAAASAAKAEHAGEHGDLVHA